MRIDYMDGRPIYEQIVDHYKYMILKGVMEQDEQMPSVRALAMELSTNPNTVQKAYAELERQGYLYSVKGKGNFVRGDNGQKERKIAELREKLAAIFREAEALGIDRETLLRDSKAGMDGSKAQEPAAEKSGGSIVKTKEAGND